MHSLRDLLIFLGLSVILNPEHGQKWIFGTSVHPAVLAMPGDIAESFDIKLQKYQSREHGEGVP
jgi:hypothetical protein